MRRLFPAGWRRRCKSLLLAGLGFLFAATAGADPALISLTLPTADYSRVREALQNAVEEQGLVWSPPNAFGDMLARTGPALDQGESPYGRAEVFQFCSALVSWQLVREDPTQIGLCPLSIALYTLRAAPGAVHLVYRSPGEGSPGRQRASALLRSIAARTASQW